MAYQSEIEKLEQRYRENPDQWFAALADSYRKAGNLELALDVVRAGLAKRPNYVSGHIVLGRCLLQTADDPAANQAFEKVLTLDGENVIALKALSEISERAGRVADAQRWLGRLLEVDPMNEEAEQALVKLKAAAPPPPAPAERAEEERAGERAGEEERAETAGEGAAAEAAGPVAGFEATAAEMPSAPVAAADSDFALEKSVEAMGGSDEPVSLDALELESTADTPSAVASAPAPPAPPSAGVGEVEGVESMAFEPPPPTEAPAPAPDLVPMEFEPPAATEPAPADAGLAVQPFDTDLAWGTGERTSRQVSQEDIAAAEQAHDAALEPVSVPEAVEAGGGPGEVEAAEEAAAPAGSGDLPLIFPDDGPQAAPAPAPREAARDGEGPGAEPEPVVTETMADLYAKQGLVAEARDIYQKLLAQRPGDAGLQARLAALEGGPGGRISQARVAAAGGPSARDFLSQVFGGEAAAAQAAQAAQGAPTRRASDEVSLASVFGEEPAPAARPGAATPPQAKPAGGGQGFSFDEFFGAPRGAGGATAANGPAEGGDDSGADDDEFKRWLKGLKS
jgi:tetratricopeptide (TPR) repeat protein